MPANWEPWPVKIKADRMPRSLTRELVKGELVLVLLGFAPDPTDANSAKMGQREGLPQPLYWIFLMIGGAVFLMTGGWVVFLMTGTGRGDSSTFSLAFWMA